MTSIFIDCDNVEAESANALSGINQNWTRQKAQRMIAMSLSIEEAEDIIKKHQNKPPVLVSLIAKEMGIDILKVSEWPDNISGMLKREKDDKFVIYVNENHSKVRRRFTVAHEIAHYILHRHMMNETNNQLIDDTLYRNGLSNLYESAANRYATEILMPWSLVNAAIDSGISEIADLAKAFNVSNSTMSIRLGIPFEVDDVRIS